MNILESQFDVFLSERLVGHLVQKGDSTRFFFDEDYLRDPLRPVLGLYFEESTQRVWKSTVRLPAWFSNLLPEGALADWIAEDRHTSRAREMELLAQVGHDLPGAVRVLPNETSSPHPGGDWEVLIHPPDPEKVLTPRWRFSLAGVSLKFSMLQQGERFTAPAVGDVGDWIVKLPDPKHENVPHNEFTIMRLAQAAGIEVPETRLVHRDSFSDLPDDVWGGEEFAYAVRRFDRDEQRACIHIEDLCQVRGLYPDRERKYTGSFETVAALFYRNRDLSSLEEFVRRLTYLVLIGNGDAHLKNWSLIYRHPRRPQISPAYDLVSTFVYRPLGQEEDLGLSFAGSRDFNAVGPASLERLAKRLKVKAPLGEIAVETARRVKENLGILEELLAPIHPEMAQRIEERIERFARGFIGE